MLLVLHVLNVTCLTAQKIPVEVLTGHQAVNTQFLLNRRFAEGSKFGVFSIVNFNMPYDRENPIYKYHIVQANVYYALTKHLSGFVGGFTNPKDYGGSIGLQASLPFKQGLIFLSNRNAVLTNYASEFLVLAEYRAKLLKSLHLYSRVQLMSETNFVEATRNFQMLRLGLGYKQFQFGLGATFDQFGSKPIKESNVGMFVRAEL